MGPSWSQKARLKSWPICLLRHIEVTTNGHLEGNLAKEREAGSSEMRLLIRSDGDDCDDDDHHDDDDDDDGDGKWEWEWEFEW